MPEADNAHTKVVAEILTNKDWTDMKQHAIDTNKGILLQFTAQWCPPCRVISPVVSSLAEQYAPSVNFIKADIDNAAISDVVAEHSVSAVPMFVAYSKDGSRSTTFTGADKQALQKAVEALSQ
jgi:thioredoxin 1